MSIDRNHHHCHQASSGDVLHFYNPQYFLSKAKVDAVGDEIDVVQKHPACKYKLRVPEEAIIACDKSHTASNTTNQN